MDQTTFHSNMTPLERKAVQCLDERRDELFDLLKKLISFDTQNFGTDGREENIVPFMEALYGSLGLETEVYCPDQVPGVLESDLFWPGHHTDHRPNVTGICYGRDRDSRVMLAAHTDTMPAGDLSAWTHSPFEGVLKDGRIYGLGSCDDKFGIAGSFMALKVLKDMGLELDRTVLLTAYSNEEFGGGNGALAACVKYPCDAYVNLDGGSYEMWAAALGGGCFKLHLHLNRVSDDCMPIYKVLAAYMDELDVFGQRRRDELSANPFYEGTPMATSAFRVASVGCVGETHTDAEIAFVIYTDRTKAEIDAELAEIVEKLRPMMEEAQVTTDGFQGTTRFFQYGQTDQTHPAFRTMHDCAQQAAGHTVRVCGSCLTDLSVIFGGGKTDSSFNFGVLRDFSLPGGAHQPDEYVDCLEFLNFTKALLLFLMRYGGVREDEDAK